MSKIRVAIAGVGNCASSLIQGVEYYRDAEAGETVPGLMHVVLGGYHVSDLDFVAAFDVDAAKVGTDLGKAIFAGQNNTIRFASVGDLGRRPSSAARPSTGSASTTGRRSRSRRPSRSTWWPHSGSPAPRSWSATCRSASEQAQRFYADACLQAGVGFVNAIPVFIASDPEWAQQVPRRRPADRG